MDAIHLYWLYSFVLQWATMLMYKPLKKFAIVFKTQEMIVLGAATN